MALAVIDYGAGNLPNVVRALRHLGVTLEVTSDPRVVAKAPAVVLPGVGATRDTMDTLTKSGLDQVIVDAVARGVPFLGICVGMQVLLDQSDEFGTHACLGIIRGNVTRFPGQLKVPQIGWNQVRYTAHHPQHALFDGISDGSDFYFVHSYYCAIADTQLVAGQTDYGLPFASAIVQHNLAAVQFHPEKSGATGLRLMHNFVTHMAELKSEAVRV